MRRRDPNPWSGADLFARDRITRQQPHRRRRIHQIEAPTVKDCLVAWAGRVDVGGLTDEGRTRLRGDMADFDSPPLGMFENTWKFSSDLGREGRAG